MKENVVSYKLGFILAEDIFGRKIKVHVLKSLKTFRQIVIVDLLIESLDVQLAQSGCTVNVEPSTFFNQINSVRFAKTLLGDILRVFKNVINYYEN